MSGELSPDRQRVVDADGSRSASMGEQVTGMQDEIRDYVVRMVPFAVSGTIVVDTDEAGGLAVLSISLSGQARPLPVDEAPEQDREATPAEAERDRAMMEPEPEVADEKPKSKPRAKAAKSRR